MALKYINEDGTEIKEYDITLKTEVTLELIAGISADLEKYLEKQKISEEEKPLNPLAVMSWDLEKMRKQLYKCKTMEEVIDIQNKIIYIRDFIKQIEEN